MAKHIYKEIAVAETKLIKLPPPDKLLQLKDFLGRTIVGQPKALDVLSRKFAFYFSPLREMRKPERKRPIGSFLFLGPTGVGKTEVARRLAQFLTGYFAGLDRIDCGNLTEKWEASKLLGAAPGLVGFEDDPPLSDEAYARKIAALKSGKLQTKNKRRLPPEQVAALMKASTTRDWLSEKRERLLVNIDYWRRAYLQAKEMAEKTEPIPGKTGRSKLAAERLTDRLERSLVQNLEMALSKLNELYAEQLGINGRIEKMDEDIAGLMENTEFMINLRPNGLRVLDPNEWSSNTGESSSVESETPVRVVLWDEFEKAHPDIWNISLAILEEGELQLAHGGNPGRDKGRERKSVADFSNSIHIFSANVGGRRISDLLSGKGIGYATQSREDMFEDAAEYERRILSIANSEAEKKFPPEFLKRLDGIIVFRPLDRDGLNAVLDVQINEFNESIMHKQLELELDSEARNYVIKNSTQRLDSGARLIRHKVESLIMLPLSQYVREDISPGVIKAKLEGKELNFYYTPSDKV